MKVMIENSYNSYNTQVMFKDIAIGDCWFVDPNEFSYKEECKYLAVKNDIHDAQVFKITEEGALIYVAEISLGTKVIIPAVYKATIFLEGIINEPN